MRHLCHDVAKRIVPDILIEEDCESIDVSRQILTVIECKSTTTDEAIRDMRIAMEYEKIKQCY